MDASKGIAYCEATAFATCTVFIMTVFEYDYGRLKHDGLLMLATEPRYSLPVVRQSYRRLVLYIRFNIKPRAINIT